MRRAKARKMSAVQKPGLPRRVFLFCPKDVSRANAAQRSRALSMLYKSDFAEEQRRADHIRNYWLARGYVGVQTRVEKVATVREGDDKGIIYGVRSNISPMGFPPRVASGLSQQSTAPSQRPKKESADAPPQRRDVEMCRRYLAGDSMAFLAALNGVTAGAVSRTMSRFITRHMPPHAYARGGMSREAREQLLRQALRRFEETKQNKRQAAAA
jgi:hypothetical protein